MTARTQDATAATGAMIEAIRSRGTDVPSWIAEALVAVPRHQFAPPVGIHCATGARRLIDREADPAQWWAAVYGLDVYPEAIVSQLDNGATDIREPGGDYTSSISAPGTVVDLLGLLDVDPGNRVLEIGTGTGWTAALLAHLAGDAGRVTSVEVDPGIAERAAKNLGEAGALPHLVVGDGAEGWSAGAPYDRVHATCSVRAIPYAWVEQCRPGALIVAPYGPGFTSEYAVRLRVTDDGRAVGHFQKGAYYMRMRSHVSRGGDPDDGSGRWLDLDVDVRTIIRAPGGADVMMSALTGMSARRDGEDRLYLFTGESLVWGGADYLAGENTTRAYELGDRQLWREVVDAYFAWVEAGEPDATRFGLTVSAEGEQIWLDRPSNPVGPMRPGRPPVLL